jgi:uncharacterized membrane protein
VTIALARTVMYFILLFEAFVTYKFARWFKFTVDQALVAALISTVCTIGSWNV